MAMDITLIAPKEGEFNKFQYWFAKAWEDAEGKSVCDIRIPHKLRALGGRLFGRPFWRSNKKVVILGCHRIESKAWPWCCVNEIVPMMWDLWPENFDYFVKFLKSNRVKLCFVTASQNVGKIKKAYPGVEVVWVPEGIKVSEYKVGKPLAERTIDILNYGRNVSWVNEAIESYDFNQAITHVYNRDGKHYFKDFNSLLTGIRNSKMAICYPQCDTNPLRCGDVETLTQRYWECMLSGTLMIGRAPKELVEICDYNPVITLNDDPAPQIENILNNIDDYQKLADRNRMCAEEKADWSNRIPIVLQALKSI